MKQNKHFHQGVKRILEQDERYCGEAFHFVHRAVNFTHKMKMKSGGKQDIHVTCMELLDGIRKFAIQQYGPMAMKVFAAWGITSTTDFGNIVFLMAEGDLIGVNEDDHIDQFQNIYDFHDAFAKPFMASGKHVPVPIIDEA